jgi:hypothetical protein
MVLLVLRRTDAWARKRGIDAASFPAQNLRLMAKGNHRKPANRSALEFETQLWAAADKLRGHIDASEYKHVVLRDALLPKLLPGELRVSINI